MTVRIWITQLLPSVFALLTRAFVLFAFIGIFSADTVHAHQTETLSPVAAQASMVISQNDCCHTADQSGQTAECSMSLCCNLLMLAGNGGQNFPLASSSTKPLIGPKALASQYHLPILHPPISI